MQARLVLNGAVAMRADPNSAGSCCIDRVEKLFPKMSKMLHLSA